MFEYLECLMEGLKTMGGERIKMPEGRRFDPEESCMYIVLRFFIDFFSTNNFNMKEKHSKIWQKKKRENFYILN